MVPAGTSQHRRDKLRILCLGGWRTNARVLDEQLNITGIRDACKDIAEFVAIDPTHLAEGSPDTRVARLDPKGPYYQWWYFDTVTGPPECGADDQTSKRVIWHGTEDNESPPRRMSSSKVPVYRGLDTTLSRLANILSTGSILPADSGMVPVNENSSTGIKKNDSMTNDSTTATLDGTSSDGGAELSVALNGEEEECGGGAAVHFDGVFGFSQGACCTALMAMLANAGDKRFAGKFRFVMLASGFRPQVPDLFSRFVDVRPIRCPSLHIMSEKDHLYHSCKQLRADFLDGHVLLHDRGHSLPPAAGLCKLDFVHFLEMQQSAKRKAIGMPSHE